MPRPETPSLSLTRARSTVGLRAPDACQRVGDVVGGVQVFESQRVGYGFLAEERATAGFGTQREQPRVSAIHRDTERKGEVTLGRVVT